MNKPKANFAVALLVILILVGLLCSQQLALLFGGFSLSARTITEYTDRGGVQWKALLTSDDGSPALVLLQKVFPCIWVLDVSDSSDEQMPGWADLVWMSQQSSRWHENSSLAIGWERHYVCTGNNAKKPLVLDQELLPRGAAVDIWQQGEEYYIHVTTNRDDLSFSVYHVLLEEGLITDIQPTS